MPGVVEDDTCLAQHVSIRNNPNIEIISSIFHDTSRTIALVSEATVLSATIMHLYNIIPVRFHRANRAIDQTLNTRVAALHGHGI